MDSFDFSVVVMAVEEDLTMEIVVVPIKRINNKKNQQKLTVVIFDLFNPFNNDSFQRKESF